MCVYVWSVGCVRVCVECRVCACGVECRVCACGVECRVCACGVMMLLSFPLVQLSLLSSGDPKSVHAVC